MKEFHSAELLSFAPPPVDYIVDCFLPVGSGGDISGPPGEGKSTIALSLCGSISSGVQWFGLRVRQTPVAWITGEASGRETLARDLHRLNLPAEADILFIAPKCEIFRFSQNRWHTTDEGEAVLARVRESRIGMVVLDTIGSLVAGSREIDNDQQRQLARHLRECLRGTTWLTISHTNQSSAKDDLAWRLHYLSRAGGNGFPGAVRWAAGVGALSEDEARDLGLPAGRRLVAFGASKHNEMPRPVWTNRSPSIFEIQDCGGLLLVRDGREQQVKKEKKEVRHGQQRPAVCTI